MRKLLTSRLILFASVLFYTGVGVPEQNPSSHSAPAPSPLLEETAGAEALSHKDPTPLTSPPAQGRGAGVLNLLAPEEIPILESGKIDEETLWLARCIFSETKRPQEQEVVAWVVRNRVESGYRGKRTYRDVVLDPFQFSAFNPDTLGSNSDNLYEQLTAESKAPGWRRAMSIAFHVRHADPALRPFSVRTRHFYSERSMVEQSEPDWAKGQKPVKPKRPYRIEERRFRFFEGVA